MKAIMEKGREYRKDGGSRAGLLRKSLDFAALTIRHPETRPLVPVDWSHKGLIVTCTEADVEPYLLKYLYNPELPETNEDYTYAQWLYNGIHDTAKCYAREGLYNQHCVMPVGDPYDVWLINRAASMDFHRSIACMRMIDTRIINIRGVDLLHYYIYFRAWNHFGAMPLNLAGIQMLKEVHAEIIAAETGKPITPGPSIIMSKDVHINDIEWEAARAWLA